jgi:predicted  nucleic acid-binding Zn-ribbon protein
LDEKRRREEELLNIEKNYRGLNDEVDQMRDRFKDIKKKYVASLTELRDIQIEH